MNESDVVWWSDRGHVLHRDVDCPPFLRARRLAIAAMERGDYERGVTIRSFDFNEDSMVGGNAYPPESFTLCSLCIIGRRATLAGREPGEARES